MRYDAKAIGSGSEGAQNELQDSYTKVRPFIPPPFFFRERGMQLMMYDSR